MAIEIIAEIGSNHNRDLGLVKQLVRGSAQAGAQVAKFQTFKARNLYSGNTPVAAYLKDNEFTKGKTTWEFISELELPEPMYDEIQKTVAEAKLEFMSTPFGTDELAFLLAKGLKRIKIGSSEITNFPLLAAAGESGRPVLLSTGMSTMGDIERALTVLMKAGARDISLLHCVVAYPAIPEDYNLRVLGTLRTAFGLNVGVSDHTRGTLVPILSVAMGATVIEKHVTLDRSLPGPDHQHATTLPEFAEMCLAVRQAEAALGNGIKRVMPAEEPLLKYRAGLVLKKRIAAGQVITKDDIAVKRPAFGIPSHLIDVVIGRKATRDLDAEAMLTWDMV